MFYIVDNPIEIKEKPTADSAAAVALPTFYTWRGPSTNLGCRSETCCMRLAANTGRKYRHLGTIAQFCRAISSQLRYVTTIGKKLVKQQYILHTS